MIGRERGKERKKEMGKERKKQIGKERENGNKKGHLVYYDKTQKCMSSRDTAYLKT